MSNQTHRVQWEAYSDAWASLAPEKRAELLAQSVCEDLSFSNPDTQGSGLEVFTEHIERFQEQFPGAHFETKKFLEHHGQSVAEWKMLSRDGSELLTGTSVARYGEDGKLTHVAGFWTR